MSHLYRLACLTCNSCTKEVSGTDKIREFVNNWSRHKSAISEVFALGLFDCGDLENSFYYKSIPSDIYEFMLEHEHHELVIRSEYYPNQKDETIEPG